MGSSVTDWVETTPLAGIVDATYLSINTSDEDQAQAVRVLCEQAKHYLCRAVCVRPKWVALAKSCLAGTPIKVATVIGFPLEKLALNAPDTPHTLGSVPIAEKLAEIQQALEDGADEFDLVPDWARFFEAVTHHQSASEVKTLVSAAWPKPIKLILETDLFSLPQIGPAVLCAVEASVACVKTSTGYIDGGQGATVDVIAAMRKALDECATCEAVTIKASGGIRTRTQAQSLREAGADVLGLSQLGAVLD